MKPLIDNARIAWNPVAAVGDRYIEGTLKVSNVIAPYLGVVIACNLFATGAQQFFFQSLEYSLTAMGYSADFGTDHPLMANQFAKQFMASIGVLIPALGVSLLPSAAFYPAGRSATVASLLIVAAAFAFYGAAITAPLWFIAGLIASGDPQAGWNFMMDATPLAVLVAIALLLFFWFRVLVRELGLGGGQVAVIFLCWFGTLVVAGFAIFSLMSVG